MFRIGGEELYNVAGKQRSSIKLHLRRAIENLSFYCPQFHHLHRSAHRSKQTTFFFKALFHENNFKETEERDRFKYLDKNNYL